MWFEIIPSALVVIGGIWFAPAFSYVQNFLVVRNCYRRSLDTREFRMQYLRDIRLDERGNPYKVHGLERIPDEKDKDEEDCSNGDVQGDDDDV